MKIIKEEYAKGQQDIKLNKVIQSDQGLKISIDIRSDSYDFQSHARVSVFHPTELKWNLVASIHYSEMKTPSKLYYKVAQNQHANSVAESFKDDLENLVSQAEQILDQKFSPEVKPKVNKRKIT